MRCLLSILVCLFACAATARAADAPPARLAPMPALAAAGSFTVLCYHEARDDVRDYPDPHAVDTAALVQQFAWLRGNGFTPVSLDAIIAARRGGAPLPPKAVLLTFDDGYLSFYTRVYPLLREFGYPAVLGVVGAWIDKPRGAEPLYGEKATVTEASFPTWAQLREMTASGLVEISSHTYDLHRGILANPQGNLQPAATARAYDAVTQRYEDDAAWRLRVRADLAKNSAVIERETGRRPRVVVWPYGSYNDELVSMARGLGMPVALTLEDGVNTPDVPLDALRRTLVEHNPALAEFAAEVRGPLYAQPVRVVAVNLDDVYSPDPLRQDAALSALLDRVLVLKPTHVYLRATSDADANGVADGAYFPTQYLPLRADLLNRVAWQLATRADVKVFASLLLAGVRLPAGAIPEIYADLARRAPIDGLVFEGDFPQAGVAGAADDDAVITANVTARVRAFRAPLKTARVLYAEHAPDDAAGERFARRFSRYVAAHDYVVLQAADASAGGEGFAGGPATLTVHIPGDRDASLSDAALRRKLIFLLHAGPGLGAAQRGQILAGQMRALQLGGAINFGFGPDGFARDDPPLSRITPAMSLRVYPLAPVGVQQ
jgi:biofilm PGA synthesis lipoprotein PgaB